VTILNATDQETSTWSLEHLCLAGAFAAAAFAAYISLVPFAFQAFSLEELRRALASSFEAGIGSRSNFLANIVLFVPVGFFGAGALARRSSALVRDLALFAAAGVLSAAIEALQVAVPGRTPSLADVGAQALGTAVGYGLWRLIRDEIREWHDRFSTDSAISGATTLLAFYAVCRAIALLLPFDVTVDLGTLAQKFRAGALRVVPFAHFSGAGDLPDAVTTMLLSVPLGVLATLGWTRPGTRRGVLSAVLAATAFLALLETAQVLVISRVADATDVVTGAAGAAMGVALASRRTEARRHAPRTFVSLGPLSAIFAAAALYVIYNWSPFDFQVSRMMVAERLPMLAAVPFSNYYQNTELQAVSDFATKLLVAMPLGIVAGLLVLGRGARFPRVGWVTTLALAVVFFTAVEAGQLFLRSRYPDDTDILIAVLGFTAGVWLTMQFAPRREPSPTGH
jgi:glycopeptide antibiotics resistance protein